MKKSLQCLVSILICLPLCAQHSYRYRHYDEKDGLAQRYVTNIVQGDDGFIWIGTWNGLDRFDGYEFVNFKQRPGDGNDIVSDRIVGIWKNSKGDLWCLMDSFLYLFDTKTYKYSKVLESLEKDEGREFNINYVLSQPDGTSVVFCADSTYILIDDNAPLSSARIAPEGKKYAFAEDRGTKYTIPGADTIKTRYCMTDAGGDLWFKSHYGLYVASEKKLLGRTFPQEGTASTRFFLRDSKGRLWVSNKEDKTLRIFDSEDRLMGYVDRSGHIVKQYTSFGASVYCMCEDGRGIFWMGCKPEGLFRLEETPSGFTKKNFLFSNGEDITGNANAVFDIKEDHKGRIWVASFSEGINVVRESSGGDFTLEKVDGGLGDTPHVGVNMVRTITFVEPDVMIATTTDGILVADTGKDDLKDIRFMWHVREPERENSLGNNATMYAYKDKFGKIYICTESGGMCEILSSDLLSPYLEFKHYNESVGFPSDVVLSVFENGDDLWAIGNDRLVCISKDRDTFESFDAGDFRDNARFSDATPVKLSDGRWLIGLQDGAVTVALDSLSKSGFVPQLAVTGVSIQQGNVRRDVRFGDVIKLYPPARNIIVYFAALDYAGSGNLQYEFRVGSGTWNRIGEDHSATLVDLRPGKYSLQVRSTNHDGEWVDNTGVLTIVVRPTFWESTFAKILYLLLVALLLWGIFKTIMYIRGLKAQNENLEAYLKLIELSTAKGATQEEKEIQEMRILEKAHIKAAENVFMRRVVSFVEDHISDPDISIDDMADAAATSRSSLNRKVKEILGITPIDFLREVRIQKACQMLRETDLTVNEVAYECGFSDPKYFSRSFKSKMGMSPSDYKNQYKTLQENPPF